VREPCVPFRSAAAVSCWPAERDDGSGGFWAGHGRWSYWELPPPVGFAISRRLKTGKKQGCELLFLGLEPPFLGECL
jgi:hypothetical protein